MTCKQIHEATVKTSSEFLNVYHFLTFAYQFILTDTEKLITELKINDIQRNAYLHLVYTKRMKSTSFTYVPLQTKYNTFFFRIKNSVPCLYLLLKGIPLLYRKAAFQALFSCVTPISTLAVPSDGQGQKVQLQPLRPIKHLDTYTVSIMCQTTTVRKTR